MQRDMHVIARISWGEGRTDEKHSPLSPLSPPAAETGQSDAPGGGVEPVSDVKDRNAHYTTPHDRAGQSWDNAR